MIKFSSCRKLEHSESAFTLVRLRQAKSTQAVSGMTFLCASTTWRNWLFRDLFRVMRSILKAYWCKGQGRIVRGWPHLRWHRQVEEDPGLANLPRRSRTLTRTARVDEQELTLLCSRTTRPQDERHLPVSCATSIVQHSNNITKLVCLCVVCRAMDSATQEKPDIGRIQALMRVSSQHSVIECQ